MENNWHDEIVEKSNRELNTAFHIIGELMNKDCFDFTDVENLNYEERKEYLRDKIFEYFNCGEFDLGGVIERVDTTDYLYEGILSSETIANINEFFKNELLVADIILLMDEDMYTDVFIDKCITRQLN